MKITRRVNDPLADLEMGEGGEKIHNMYDKMKRRRRR